jgi:hypothetical protein
MSQVEKDGAYIRREECNVCEEKEGKLHLWHCVFRDPYHYMDYTGDEVRLPRPAPPGTSMELQVEAMWAEYDYLLSQDPGWRLGAP